MSRTDSSAASFAKLLSALDADREVAEQNYIEIQNRLMMKFDQRGCRDSYVLAVDTLKRVERALWEGVMIEKNIYAFIHAVANNVLREYWKHPALREVEISERIELPDKQGLQNARELDEAQITLEARIDCLERCLSELPPETRALFLEYYDESQRKKKDSRKEVADRLGMNLNALRQRMHRIKKDLNDCISRCMQTRTGRR